MECYGFGASKQILTDRVDKFRNKVLLCILNDYSIMSSPVPSVSLINFMISCDTVTTCKTSFRLKEILTWFYKHTNMAYFLKKGSVLDLPLNNYTFQESILRLILELFCNL